MWNYEKRLQYPVKITQTNPQIAKVIIHNLAARIVVTYNISANPYKQRAHDM